LLHLSGVHLTNMSCNCEGLTNGRSRNNWTLVADESHHAPLFFFAQISEPPEVPIIAKVGRSPLCPAARHLHLLLCAALPHGTVQPPPCRRTAARERSRSSSSHRRAVRAAALHRAWHRPIASWSVPGWFPKMWGRPARPWPLNTAISLSGLQVPLGVFPPGHPRRRGRQHP